MGIVAGLRWALLAIEVWIGLPILYLAVVAVVAVVAALGRRSRVRERTATLGGASHTFVVIVPAHNEQDGLDPVLASLAALDYPRDHYRVCVVADNCTDRTAEVAQAGGAQVYVRTDAARRGKGYALAWMLHQLDEDQVAYDACVVIDADAVVGAGFLRAMDRELARGAQALQAHNNVLNVRESATTALRWIALSLMNHVRPLGRNALGGSSTLTGNGMCLRHDLLREHPWRAFGITEDYQYYLALVEQGLRVRYVPEATVLSVMPTTFKDLHSQDVRWESPGEDQGKQRRRTAWRLFVDGVRGRDWVRLEALAELLTPPLSLLASGCLAALLAAALLGGAAQMIVAVGLAVALLVYMSSAFWLLRPPLAVYRALLYAPWFAAHKLWIYFVARRNTHQTATWIRTSRTLSAKSSTAKR